MAQLRYSKIEEEDFVPIIELLNEDTEEIKEIASLFQREYEYADFLAPIESFIAYYWYFDNKKLKDVDVVKTLRNIKRNLDKNLDYFKGDFEREFVGAINATLYENQRKITKHEFSLVLKYILWSIDNRRGMEDSQGYLKWVANFFGLLEDEDKEKFDKLMQSYGAKAGKSDEEVKMMKAEGEKEPSAEDVLLSKKDSEDFEENMKEMENSEEGEWLFGNGGFMKSMSQEEFEDKKGSLHMEHDKHMNYNCRKCNKKISLHNRDWHDGMCDECFNKTYHQE